MKVSECVNLQLPFQSGQSQWTFAPGSTPGGAHPTWAPKKCSLLSGPERAVGKFSSAGTSSHGWTGLGGKCYWTPPLASEWNHKDRDERSEPNTRVPPHHLTSPNRVRHSWTHSPSIMSCSRSRSPGLAIIVLVQADRVLGKASRIAWQPCTGGDLHLYISSPSDHPLWTL